MSWWFRFVAWLKVLWVCRVSFLIALSALLFVKVQPASDLLLDLRPTGSWALWVLFFVVFVVWTMVVYVSARLAVMSHAWAVNIPNGRPVELDDFNELRDMYLWPTRVLPIIIPAFGAVFVVAALIYARDNIPVLPEDAKLQDALARLLMLNAGAAAAYTIAVLLGVLALYGVLRPGAVGRWPPFLPHLRVVSEDGKPIARADLPLTGERPRVSVWFGVLAAIIFGGAMVVLAAFILRPQLATELQRATLAFVLLSLWVPVLTWLSILSHKLRFPVLLVGLIVGLLVFNLVGDNHQIRTETAAGPQPAARPTMDEWVTRWRHANGCLDDEAECKVRPILVAASGGASRAAFFTASALGRLLDLTCVRQGDGCEGGQPSLVNQIFAVSSVSGSTLGAAAFVTALDQSETLAADGPRLQPCKATYTANPEAGDSPQEVVERWFGRVWKILSGERREAPDWDRHAFDFWHGVEKPDGEGKVVTNWQDCLELTVTGDYLSPTVASLVVRDVLPVRGWNDRNRALEDAFDRHISAVLAEPAGNEDALLFDREFLTLWQNQMADEPKGLWRPLLVSNGSSVGYGNRILTSPIGRDGDHNWPFLDSTDTYELINAAADGNCGIPIKVAVSNSARFPLVSTEGDFPRPSETCEPDNSFFLGAEKNEDQIVDGGYYESIGLTSVYDLALALKAEGLDPFVVTITNDPSVALACPRDRALQSEAVGGAFGTPIEAVSAARSARGVMSLEALKVLSGLTVKPDGGAPGTADVEGNVAMLRAKSAAGVERAAAPAARTTMEAPVIAEQTPAERKAACLKVYGENGGGQPVLTHDYGEDFAFIDVIHPENIFGNEMPSISLNWWLSRPVQTLLRINVAAEHNKAAFVRICEVVADRAARSQCLRELQSAVEYEIAPASKAAE